MDNNSKPTSDTPSESKPADGTQTPPVSSTPSSDTPPPPSSPDAPKVGTSTPSKGGSGKMIGLVVGFLLVGLVGFFLGKMTAPKAAPAAPVQAVTQTPTQAVKPSQAMQPQATGSSTTTPIQPSVSPTQAAGLQQGATVTPTGY